MSGIRIGLWRTACLCALAAGMRLAAFAGEYDSYLLWWVNDPTVQEVNSPTRVFIDGLVSRPDGFNANGARLRVVLDDGDPVYFDLFDGTSGIASGSNTLPLNYTSPSDEGVWAGPVFADLGDYASPGYSFFVELGHLDGDEWTVMAASEASTYSALVAGGFTTNHPVNYPGYLPWSPTGYVVPEPTSGLLLLIGGAFLALRRKGRARCPQRAAGGNGRARCPQRAAGNAGR